MAETETCRIVLSEPDGKEWACGRDVHTDDVPHAASIAFDSVYGPIFGVLVWVVSPTPEAVATVAGAFGTA